MAKKARGAGQALGRVLVTTDFSSLGDQAVAMVFGMAPTGAAVRLLHVVHPRALGRGEYETGVLTTPQHTAHVRALEQRLRDLVPRGAGRRDIAADAMVVEHEEVGQAVAAEAERFDADVVAISSHGEAGLRGLVVGSTAQAVMARCKRPVMVLRFP